RWRKSRNVQNPNPKLQIPTKNKRPGDFDRPGLFDLGFGIWVLRSARLPRRRRLLRFSPRLAAGLPLRRPGFASRAEAARGRPEAVADALGLRSRGLLGALLFGRFRVVLAANQLDLRHFGGIAAAEANPENARVAARPLRVARGDRLEQLADH